ncbi:MAG: hypothetical protein HUU01_12475 [Saprospiraceae bacterium]|nr:hypothetical protein [Saprospiraceae bacterium]
MSELVKPNKVYDEPDYAKYLLMNTNTCFCQSEISDAEKLMAEIETIDPAVHKSIPGFVAKKEALETKMKAYHDLDAIWKQFLQTKEANLEELENLTAAKSSCEKKTLAKYSYMVAYAHYCEGNVPKSKDIFENRTLRLTEKTTLRVKDVEGLAPEVAKMKSMFQSIDKLDIAWKAYIKTGVSRGFDAELPVFPCNPTPKMKELVLKGAVDLCNLAPAMLDKIKKLQAESSVPPDAELAKEIEKLEKNIGQNEEGLAALNEAWEAFIPNNKVNPKIKYGYKYCTKEPLIRAYIMDGFAFTCDLAEDMLQKIDSLQRIEITPLEEITMVKINELSAINDRHKADGVKIEKLWNKFVGQGDKPLKDYQSAEYYCDNIHQVKDWTIRGLSGTCEEAPQYLEQIESFQRTFEFQFTEPVECRVQNLRVKVWDCRYQALQKLAKIEASPADSYEKKLEELMKEYEMSERPEPCTSK